MRQILVLVLLLLLPVVAVPPAAAVNQCVTDTTARIVCVAVPIASPDPRVPLEATGVYVYISGPECSSAPTGTGCRAIVFQETNDCPGLQRRAITGCGGVPADTKLVA